MRLDRDCEKGTRVYAVLKREDLGKLQKGDIVQNSQYGPVVFERFSEEKDRIAFARRDGTGKSVEHFYDVCDIRYTDGIMKLNNPSKTIEGTGVEALLVGAGL